MAHVLKGVLSFRIAALSSVICVCLLCCYIKRRNREEEERARMSAISSSVFVVPLQDREREDSRETDLHGAFFQLHHSPTYSFRNDRPPPPYTVQCSCLLSCNYPIFAFSFATHLFKNVLKEMPALLFFPQLEPPPYRGPSDSDPPPYSEHA